MNKSGNSEYGNNEPGNSKYGNFTFLVNQSTVIENFRNKPIMHRNFSPSRHHWSIIIACILLASLAFSRQTLAGTMYQDCYNIPGYPPPELPVNKVLYVLVDQTMNLTAAMQQSVVELISDWGQHGENVKISRFSANINGQYTELLFDEIGNVPPTQEFLFHLRRKDKRVFLQCIKTREHEFKKQMTSAIGKLLKITDDKLPQTNLIHSLNDFANKLISVDNIPNKTVLIISDGLEHSDLFSFHKRGVIKKVNSKKSMAIVRKSNLIPDWKKTKIYFFGLGYISDQKFYVRPSIINPLSKFWVEYFKKGNATLYRNSLGTPMLLTKSIL
ncbi:MAG: hypothetical protein ACC707_07215 [Thiohalomonadales bacterium]